jgi:hypothetical protein
MKATLIQDGAEKTLVGNIALDDKGSNLRARSWVARRYAAR